MTKYVIVLCDNSYALFKSMDFNGDITYTYDENEAFLFDSDVDAKIFRNENLGWKNHSVEQIDAQ